MRELNSIIDYHELTSYIRYELGGHSPDWANRPEVYKRYANLESVLLRKEVQRPDETLSELFSEKTEPPHANVTLDHVSLILLLTQTLTARSRHVGGEFFYRSVPSAGALYPCELYLAAKGVDGLEAGVYHYDLMNHALTCLRAGDFTHHLAGCLPSRADVENPLTFFVTAIFFRSAWKYRNRAYRYHLLDTGHFVENLTLALKALKLPFKVTYDFDDRALNGLLGLDERLEVALAAGRVMTPSPLLEEEAQPIPDIAHELGSASRVAPREIDYPVIRETHALTYPCIGSTDSDAYMMAHLGVEPGPGVGLAPRQSWPEVLNYAEAVWRRRSKRNFVPRELSRNRFDAMMNLLCQKDVPAGETPDIQHMALCVGFLAGHVEGLQPGFYLLDRSKATFHLVCSDHLMSPMARICLDQSWLAHAGLHFLFLTNLERLERLWGPRGYRYVMITAGRLGQRIYVGATAMGFGACGIGAFYDNEAAKLIGLTGHSRLLYLVASGSVKP